MFLAALVFFTALLMEGIGSYLSVVGWNSLLAGDWVVIGLFVTLDLAKLVSVSFLYQTWADISKSWRAYMTFAVIFLMVLTSAGSFGYLSSSFQKAIQPNKEVNLQVQTASLERDQLRVEKAELQVSKKRIEDQIANLPPNIVNGRAKLINSFREDSRGIKSKLDKIDGRLTELNKTILASQSTAIEKDTHIGPVVFIAKTFDVSLEKAVTYGILAIIFVFDPLAIMLVLSGNYLLVRRKATVEIKDIEFPVPPESLEAVRAAIPVKQIARRKKIASIAEPVSVIEDVDDLKTLVQSELAVELEKPAAQPVEEDVIELREGVLRPVHPGGVMDGVDTEWRKSPLLKDYIATIDNR